jgi:colanic acid biosynthesis glycosyl transferase WcaI
MTITEDKQNSDIRLLLISPFFYPEPISTGKYNSSLSKALVDRVFSIDVVASYPIYPDWKPKFTNQNLNGITIHRGGDFIKYPAKPVLRRMILEVWFAVFAILMYFKLKKEINVIVVVFPPSLFFAILSFLIPRNIKVVGIIHDLQGIYSEKKLGFLSRVLTKCIISVEQRAFNSCNKLIFLSKTMSTRATKIYDLIHHPSKILFRYPFVSISTDESKIDNDAELEKLRGFFSDKFNHIVYSGALGEKQNPLELIIFFEAIILSLDNVRCHVFSRGPLFDFLIDNLKPDFKEKIFFHDLVAEDALQELYELSTIQIIPQAPDTSEGSLPSKLPNLLSCGVPIFAICDKDSELSEIVNASGIGYSAHTWESALLVQQISEFMSLLAHKDRIDLKSHVSDYVKNNFSISQLIDAILS